MPCPFGVDIPANFAYYNKCINEGTMPGNSKSPRYKEQVKVFLEGYDKAIPAKQQASHCESRNNCLSHCPQRIQIPTLMQHISEMVEKMRKAIV